MTDPKKSTKRLLVVVKPQRKIADMTDAERDRLAAQIVGTAVKAKGQAQRRLK